MASRQDKGKGASTSGAGRKRIRLGTAVPAAPAVPRGQRRQYGTRWVTEEGKKWYVKHKESKYFPEEHIVREPLAQEFPRIVHRIEAAGLNFIFEEPKECNLHLIREFYANWNPTLGSHTIKIRGQIVTFEPHHLNVILGAQDTDAHVLRQLNITPPYVDIRHTSCGTRSTARWSRHKERGYHQTLPYSQMNREARIWLKIVCSCLIPGVHMTDVTRDRVCLAYALMKGLEINVGAVIISTMKRARLHQGHRYGFGGLLTTFLRGLDIEEEALDYIPQMERRALDVTKTKAPNTTHGPVLTLAERHARDDQYMARMFGMQMLQLRIGGRPATEEELWQLELDYPFGENARALCLVGPAFVEPTNDDVPTDEETRRDDSDVESDDDDGGDSDMGDEAAAPDEEVEYFD